MTVRLHSGDAIALVSQLSPRSVQAVVTSPPYFQQRAYSDNPQQLGGGAQPLNAYIDYLVELFRRLLPALEPHAAIWLNLGSRFSGGGFGLNGPAMRERKSWEGLTGRAHRQRPPNGYRNRDLLPLPALVADALRAHVPLVARGEIIWSKPVAVESPRLDRPSRSHELLYLFTPTHPCRARDPGEAWWKTTVWQIPVAHVAGHPAAMPLEFARRCIVASNHPSLVLDPFCGSGTTLLAAQRLGIDAVGFDLEPRYLAEARRRLVTDSPLFVSPGSDSRDSRRCPIDGRELDGRADQVTCSDRCRQQWSRRQRSTRDKEDSERRSAHQDLLLVGATDRQPDDTTRRTNPVNRHTDTSLTKQVRRSGPPESCDFCATPSSPPDVVRGGSSGSRILHPSCAESEALAAIRDAGVARAAQTDQGRRNELRVIA